MTTIAVTQDLEICDVAGALLEIVKGIHNAATRLLKVVGDLVGPASQDPEEEPGDMSGSECKRGSAPPSKERRGHGQVG